MADDITKPNDTNPAPTSPAASISSSETTLDKDGQLGINQPTDAPTPAVEPKVDFTPPTSSQPIVDDTKGAEPLLTANEVAASDPATPTSSVIVTNQEVKPTPVETTPPVSSPSESDKVETLNGELKPDQAGETAVKVETKVGSSLVTPPSSPKTETPAAVSAPASSTTTPPTDKSAVATFNDIFSKQAEKIEKTKTELPKNMTAPTNNQGAVSASPFAVLGEVLTILGVIILALLLAGPIYQDMVSSSLYDTIQSIGWLVAPVSFAFGLIGLLLAKGRVLLKLLVVLLLIATIVFYLGLNTSGSIADQINALIGPVLDFYR